MRKHILPLISLGVRILKKQQSRYEDARWTTGIYNVIYGITNSEGDINDF